MSFAQTLKNSIREAAFRGNALVFNLAAKLPVKEDRVVLFTLTEPGLTGALQETERELKERVCPATGKPYDIQHVDRADLFRGAKKAIHFFVIDAWTMGRAKAIFINNNYFPMGWFHPNKNTSIVQVWHGQGAFKKFGLDIPQPKAVRKKELGAVKPLSYVTCSAESIRPIYMSAFGLRADQVLTTGNPVSDYFFREENVGAAAVAEKRARFDEQYPVCKDKYLVLYAPTFRDTQAEDGPVLAHLDAEALRQAATQGAGKDAVLLVRLHPVDTESRGILRQIATEYEGVLDMTDYPDSNELCVLSDVLVTDYSSICMNHALLHKPMVFYAYDMEQFAGGRDFYYPYASTVGGPVVTTMEDLLAVFQVQDFRTSKLEAFRKLHFGDFEGGATKAMLDKVL